MSQEFLNITLEKNLSELQQSYLQEEKYQCKQKAEQLKLSLYMYGIHSIQRDVEKIEQLTASSEHFEEIGPLLKNIKKHLRNVKNQMIQDFKMVITIIE